MRILVVCLGNICRSPMGQGVLQSAVDAAGLRWELDSAGTFPGHAGAPPDKRARLVMREHGLNIDHLRARVVQEWDFEYFDLILAMDESVYRELMDMQAGNWDKVRMFLPDGSSVPDPYRGELADFENVLKLLKGSAEYWLNQNF
jgi:protein-tyrosine phosphatase